MADRLLPFRDSVVASILLGGMSRKFEKERTLSTFTGRSHRRVSSRGGDERRSVLRLLGRSGQGMSPES